MQQHTIVNMRHEALMMRHPRLSALLAGAGMAVAMFGAAYLLQFPPLTEIAIIPGATIVMWVFRVVPDAVIQSVFGYADRGVFVGLSVLVGFSFWVMVFGLSILAVLKLRSAHGRVAE